MSTLAPEFEAVEGIIPTSSDLQLVESVQIEEGAVQPDGTVHLNLIRPCVGKGRGRHLYTPQMLEANAHTFTGWKMYLNHLSEQARRALGGLPRDVRDVGGIVDRSWWDPSVPAQGRFGQGAVKGATKPIKLIRDLIDLDSRLVECSINATATGVQPGKVGNERVWVVEGITGEPPGTVDWVTEAGAGGQVAGLIEAVLASDDPVDEWLESLSYDDLMLMLNESRVDLVAAARRKKPPASDDGGDGDGGTGDSGEFETLVKKFMSNGMPRPAAEKAARKAMGAKGGGKPQESNHGGEQVAELTPEEIREALASDEGQRIVSLAVREEVQALGIGDRVTALVESRLDQEREVARTEAEARLNRRHELQEMRSYAHERVEGTKLTPKLKESLRRRFDLLEGTPTPELNLVADEDENGSVTKSARAKLDESLDAAIKDAFEILAEARPTRVVDQGPRSLREASESGGDGKGGKDGGEGKEPVVQSPKVRQLLREAGFKKPDEVVVRDPNAVLGSFIGRGQEED